MLNNRPVLKFVIAVFCFVILFALLFGISVYRQYRIIKQKIASNNLSIQTEFDFSKPNQDVLKILKTEDDPSIGPKNAKLIIAEFCDFKCAYCQNTFNTIRRITTEYKDKVLFIFKDFPSVTDESLDFALAGECADEQGKFWNFHDKAFNDPGIDKTKLNNLADIIGLDKNKFETCLSSKQFNMEIQNDIIIGQNLGVTGTPTFFINGYKVAGDISYEIWKNIIEETLKKINEK